VGSYSRKRIHRRIGTESDVRDFGQFNLPWDMYTCEILFAISTPWGQIGKILTQRQHEYRATATLALALESQVEVSPGARPRHIAKSAYSNRPATLMLIGGGRSAADNRDLMLRYGDGNVITEFGRLSF
jgi:hypothetical protein